MSQIILASSSPRRRSLIRLLGLNFRTLSTNIDEKPLPGERPDEFVCRLALKKADAVACRAHAGVVLGCDTAVAVEGELFGKPGTAAEAKRMLRALSAKSHEVWSGLALLDLNRGLRWLDAERTVVYFKELSDQEIEGYVASGEPIDKAGAYAIQGKGALFIPRIEGCFFNVVGLPLYRLHSLLQKAGISLK